MSGSKHDKTPEGAQGFMSDLDRNPGIGQSGGSFATGGSPDDIAADNTVEGDVENETNGEGGVSENHLGRTNK